MALHVSLEKCTRASQETRKKWLVSVAWAVKTLGLCDITDKNLLEWKFRLELVSRLWGGDKSEVPVGIPLDLLVGAESNADILTRNQFLKKVCDKLEGEVVRKSTKLKGERT
jgi:hypothetical protein